MNDQNKKSENDHNIPPHHLAKPHPYKLAIFSLIILLAGMVIGSASTVLFMRTNAQQSFKNHMPGRGGPPRERGGTSRQGPMRMAHELQKKLDLSKEQLEQIKPIIDKHLKKLHEIRSAATPQIREELDAMKENISKVLDEEQNKKFQRQFKRFQGFGKGLGQGFGQRRQGQNRRPMPDGPEHERPDFQREGGCRGDMPRPEPGQMPEHF
jgi:hypothetical protein